MVFINSSNKLKLECNYIQKKIIKYCKLLFKTLIVLFSLRISLNNFRNQILHMIINKILFL